MCSFLKDLESEVHQQNEAAVMAVSPTPTALDVTQPHQAQNFKPGNSSWKKGPKCKNGVHNPAVTGHSEENCHAAHLEIAAMFYNAAMDWANARVAKKDAKSPFWGCQHHHLG
jgi:hypothetical protein